MESTEMSAATGAAAPESNKRTGAPPPSALILLGLGAVGVGAAVMSLIAGKKSSMKAGKGQVAKKKVSTYTSRSNSATAPSPRRPSTSTRPGTPPSPATTKSSSPTAAASKSTATAAPSGRTSKSAIAKGPSPGAAAAAAAPTAPVTSVPAPSPAPTPATSAADVKRLTDDAAKMTDLTATARPVVSQNPASAPPPTPVTAAATAATAAPAASAALAAAPAPASIPVPAASPAPAPAPAPVVVSSPAAAPAPAASPAASRAVAKEEAAAPAAAPESSARAGGAATVPDAAAAAPTAAPAGKAAPSPSAAQEAATAKADVPACATEPEPVDAAVTAVVATAPRAAVAENSEKQAAKEAPALSPEPQEPMRPPPQQQQLGEQPAEQLQVQVAKDQPVEAAAEPLPEAAAPPPGKEPGAPAVERQPQAEAQPAAEASAAEDTTTAAAPAAPSAGAKAVAAADAGAEDDLVQSALSNGLEGEGEPKVGAGGEEAAVAAAPEQEAEAEVEPQTEAELEAEQLLTAATSAWNLQGNRQQGVKLARKALTALQDRPHRPKYRSEVASSLADMLYALNKWEEALEAVGEAMAAAREAREWALAVKLSNNMGAVYKKLGRVSDAEALHRSCYDMAVAELGVAHPLALLARSNLTETLMLRKADLSAAAAGQGQADGQQAAAAAAAAGTTEPESEEDKAARDEARKVLKEALSQLEAEAATLADGATPTPAGDESQGAALLRRTRTAIIRTQIELGRLEMTAGEDPDAAEGAYRSALELCNQVYGIDSRESAGPAFNLANCLRAIGKKDEAKVLYERLYELTVERNGLGEEMAVHLARSLADLYEEADDWAAVDKYSSSALNSMTMLIGTRAHPVLESFYQAACRAKTNNGDAAGADALRRQFLSGMLRLTQQHARQQGPPGRGPPAGAAAGAAGGAGAASGKRSAGGKKSRK